MYELQTFEDDDHHGCIELNDVSTQLGWLDKWAFYLLWVPIKPNGSKDQNSNPQHHRSY